MDAVPAQPYNIKYRLSKDANVTINIYDADGELPKLVDLTPDNADAYHVRTLINNEPRLGEGSPDGGQLANNPEVTATVEVEPWDGRNLLEDNSGGVLLPRGNYLITVQAKSNDEWPGTDASLIKTYQMSLDPLKITDLTIAGLNKLSTAYAAIGYMLTEASNVHFRVYPPGTVLNKVYTEPNGVGVSPVTANNHVYDTVEQKAGRTSTSTKWDGRCNRSDGGDCTISVYSNTVQKTLAVDASDPTVVACAAGECEMTVAYPNGYKLPQGGTASTTSNVITNWGYMTNIPAASVLTKSASIFESYNPGDNINYDATRKCAQSQGCNIETVLSPNTAYSQVCNKENGCFEVKGASSTSYKYGETIAGTCVTNPVNQQCYITNRINYNAVVPSGSGVSVIADRATPTNFTKSYTAGSTITVGGTCDTASGCSIKGTIGTVPNYETTCDQATCTVTGVLTPNDGIKIPSTGATCVNASGTRPGGCDVLTNSTSSATKTDITYKNGEYMADGDYVYAIWAEIPYATAYSKRGVNYDAVKTRMYHNGIMPINRGKVDITVQPVGYSTIGSSPVAYGLDPFVFQYSISREAPVTVKVKNTKGVTVKTIITDQVQVAQQMNVYTWDGKDDQGRFIDAGTYSLEITAKDPIDTTKVYSQTALFPVDLFRVVDVADTPLLTETNSHATLSFALSKTMDVSVYIYDKGVVIPNDSVTWPALLLPPAAGAPQPIKIFTGATVGEGMTNIENWDGVAEYTAGTSVAGQYVADGLYPYMIVAKAMVPVNSYHDAGGNARDAVDTTIYDMQGNPDNVLYSTDHPTGYLTVARKEVYFLNNDQITIAHTNPKLYNSTEVITIPPYTIEFTPSRMAKVEIEVIDAEGGNCFGGTSMPGDICRNIKTSNTYGQDNIFNGNTTARVYWDGKDDRGNYAKSGYYILRLRAQGYPLVNAYPEKVAQAQFYANLFQIFDIVKEDIAPGSPTGTFNYQTSVPMKVAIQIFRPGTYIADNTTGQVAHLDTQYLDNCNSQGINGLPTCPAGSDTDPSTVCKNGVYSGNAGFWKIQCPVGAVEEKDLLVKALVGIRPELLSINQVWDGRDYAMQLVPDGHYPYRFVSTTQDNGTHMDSLYGIIDDPQYVADWSKYSNWVGEFDVAWGDGQFVCEDWKDTVIFYPNPFRSNSGKLEITRTPVPGDVRIKIFNIAGDLVRTKGYKCIDSNNNVLTMSNGTLSIMPDNAAKGATASTSITDGYTNRNPDIVCEWDKKNDHGKTVARGVYLALVDFQATGGGKEHCQKVVKILIP
ncbi:flagellar hook assembly protein FlgD [Elusimicrobium posterum]|uniref:FlgD immunoglobulin-like domain containing protein n=1 Tax=Elusimicrobium posterum TaxID=3116653 RepID=UPI003C793A9D